MAKKDKSAKAAAKAEKAAGERGSKLDEKREADAKLNLAAYATKAPTDLHERYANWLVTKLGLEFKNKAERAVFDRAVSVATALRMPFQRSDENQEANATRAAERAAAAAAPKVKAEKATKAPKATKAAKVVEEPAEAEADEAPAEKPAKATKKAAKKAAAVAEEAVATEAPAEEAKPAAKRAPRKAGAKSKAPF